MTESARTTGAKVFMAAATLLVGVVTLVVVVGVFIIISTSRQQETLRELKDGQIAQQNLLKEAADQRMMLVECLTLPPKPGMELNEADKEHECLMEMEGLRARAVARIAETNLYLHECVKADAPDLKACVAARQQAAAAQP